MKPSKTLMELSARLNKKLQAANIHWVWIFDDSETSNSQGTWFCGNLGGVTDPKTMREETKRLIAFKQANPGVYMGPAED